MKKKTNKKRITRKKNNTPPTQTRGVGRPLFDGKDEKMVVQILEQSFSIGCTDEEACMQADISPRALYYYIERNPEFLQRKELLKTKMILGARNTLNLVINERQLTPKGEKTTIPTDRSLEASKWILSKKKKDEFGDSIQFIPPNPNAPLPPERIKEISDAMDAWDEDLDEDERDEDYEVKEADYEIKDVKKNS